MWRVAAVGVNDNLPSGQTGVTLRASSYESTGGVDMDLGLIIHQLSRNCVTDYLFLNLSAQLFICDVISVLRRDNDCAGSKWTAVAVFDRYLRLAVWS